MEQLHKSVNKEIQIKVKRNRIFRGTLKSFDQHLNILLENVTYKYKMEDEQKNSKDFEEKLDQIVLRGDNVIFIEFAQ